MSPAAIEQKPVRIDTISGLSDQLHSMSSLTPLVSLLALAFQVQTPPPSQQERLITLLHTMVATSNLYELKAHSHEELIGSFIQFLSPVLSGMAGLTDFEAAVQAFSNADSFRDFWTLEGSNLIKEFIEDSAHDRIMQGCDNPFLDTFVNGLSCRVAYGEQKGILALVPGQSRVGDEIWSMNDEMNARVIRKLGNGLEEIGHAFIDQHANLDK